MKTRSFFLVVIPTFLFAILAIVAQGGERYSSVQIDDKGQLHIVTESGSEILPRKMPQQVSFGSPAISPDRKTVGWLIEYNDSDALGVSHDPIASDLVLFRNGHTIHRFPAEQVLWDWKFEDDGRRIAYTDGPLHGNPSQCVLRNVDTGRVVTRWFYDENAEPPEWATGIRCKGE